VGCHSGSQCEPLPRHHLGGVETMTGFPPVTKESASIWTNSSELFGFLYQIAASMFHLVHGLLCHPFGATSEMGNVGSYLLGGEPHVFRLWENATHLLEACLQVAPGFFWESGFCGVLSLAGQ